MKPLGTKRRWLVVAVFVAAFVVATGLVGCAGASRPEELGISVGASLPPQAWLVERIGGAGVEVFHLVGAGESPHTYQPADVRVTRVMRSAVFFRTGVPFEDAPWFEAVREAGTVRVVDLRQGLEDPGSHSGSHGGHGHRHGRGDDNPHIWLSPRLLKVQARTAAVTLSEVDPERAERYRANLASLESELDALDRELQSLLEPLRGKAFFVFHPAWGHFADAYGLEEVAIEIEGKEPSDRELTELQRRARAEGIKVIFVQPQIYSRTAEAVARAIGARIETLDPLAADVAENLRRVAKRLVAAAEEHGL